MAQVTKLRRYAAFAVLCRACGELRVLQAADARRAPSCPRCKFPGYHVERIGRGWTSRPLPYFERWGESRIRNRGRKAARWGEGGD